jgi:dipeptidyl-peptidase-4
MAGEQNATVSVHSYDIKSHVIRQMKLPLDKDGYVPRIRFTSDPDKLLVLTQNRHQDRLDIYIANPRSTECRLIVRDQVEKYITEEPYKQLQLFPEGFVLLSERDGWNHAYLYDFNGTLKRRLTQGHFVVRDFYGYNPQTGDCYYSSNEEGPQYQAVYRSDAKGRVTRLSQERGTNNAIFSKNFKYYLNVYSNITTPPVTTLNAVGGKAPLKTLEDNATLKSKLATLSLAKPEFFSFKTSEGVEMTISSDVPYAGRMHEAEIPAEGDYWTPGNGGFGWSTTGTGNRYIEDVVDASRMAEAMADRMNAGMRT